MRKTEIRQSKRAQRLRNRAYVLGTIGVIMLLIIAPALGGPNDLPLWAITIMLLASLIIGFTAITVMARLLDKADIIDYRVYRKCRFREIDEHIDNITQYQIKDIIMVDTELYDEERKKAFLANFDIKL